MTDPHADLLSETFTRHEHLAPDAPEVLTKADGLARTYRRRRRAVQATSGAVLGVGLVVGGVSLVSHLQPVHQKDSVSPYSFAAQPSSPAPVAHSQDEELRAYFNAGYGYESSVKLAALWHSTDDTLTIKAEAGEKLLNGEKLPVAPEPACTEVPVESEADTKAFSAFFNAGYNYDDAVTLAGMWHETDVSQVKIEAGNKLLHGETLPIAP